MKKYWEREKYILQNNILLEEYLYLEIIPYHSFWLCTSFSPKLFTMTIYVGNNASPHTGKILLVFDLINYIVLLPNRGECNWYVICAIFWGPNLHLYFSNCFLCLSDSAQQTAHSRYEVLLRETLKWHCWHCKGSHNYLRVEMIDIMLLMFMVAKKRRIDTGEGKVDHSTFLYYPFLRKSQLGLIVW